MKLTRTILYFLSGVFVAQFAFYYVNLPETVASHFNFAGEADGFVEKSSFLIFEAVILIVIIAEFTVLPLIIKKLPDSLINLPNKNYWLADERRVKTFDIIKTSFEWFAVMLLSLLIAVNQLVFTANISGENLSPTAIWIILSLFLAATAFWVIKFTKHFKNV